MKPSLNTCAFASIPIVSDSMVTITPIRVMVSMVWIHKIKSHDFTDLTSMDIDRSHRPQLNRNTKEMKAHSLSNVVPSFCTPGYHIFQLSTA